MASPFLDSLTAERVALHRQGTKPDDGLRSGERAKQQPQRGEKGAGQAYAAILRKSREPVRARRPAAARNSWYLAPHAAGPLDTLFDTRNMAIPPQTPAAPEPGPWTHSAVRDATRHRRTHPLWVNLPYA